MIKLTKLSENDFSTIVKWFQEESPDLLLQWAGPTFIYPLSIEQLIDHYKQGINKYDSQIFVYKILDEFTNDPIGMIQLCRIDRVARKAAVCRFWIKEHFRNKGVGTAALRKLLEISVHEFNLQRLSLKVFDFNISAIKCYEKVGFQICERNENVCQSYSGQWWGEYEMQLKLNQETEDVIQKWVIEILSEVTNMALPDSEEIMNLPLEFDSVMFIKVIVSIENKIGRDVPDYVLGGSFGKVSDIYNLIATLINE